MIYIGIVFWAGNQIITRYEANSEYVFHAIMVVFTTAFGTGAAFSNIPSMSKAKASAKWIFEIVDEKSTLDVRDATENQVKKIEHGEISFQDVTFHYPSREKAILQNFDMRIPANAKIALVGHSGCGKTTITNLLLRFYELTSGQILIDGIDIKDYNVSELRK
jgi:ATP-binding cassette subfamily B (MDR/TAP) protein 1